MRYKYIHIFSCIALLAGALICVSCLEIDPMDDILTGDPQPTDPIVTPDPSEEIVQVTDPESTDPEPPEEISPIEPVAPPMETTPQPDPDPMVDPQPPMEPETMEPEETIPTLDPGEGLAIGATAPDFSLPDGDGVMHSLSDYAGKIVVIVFYATGT